MGRVDMTESLRKAFCAAAITLVLAGCVFAPNKYGSSGIVTPGCEQFDKYLAACCQRYPVLADSCERMGTPAAIQIGNSGGYFVWHNQMQWVKVKTLGAAVITGRHPRHLRYFVGGDIYTATAAATAKQVKSKAKASPAQATERAAYAVESFQRTADDEFAYSFRVRLNDPSDAGFATINAIKQVLRNEVASDYIATYGCTAGDVKVDFPEFAMNGSVVEGRAEVMRITVMSLQYDATRQKGLISIKIGANRFEDARKWVRKNIETLARDKNIALTTGQIPPEARFYLGAERVCDGNVLEIEFETE